MKNPLSLEAFADWCEKQPADQSYAFWSYSECACAQYAAFLGMPNPYDLDIQWDSFWGRADFAASGRGRTFGALATRLREASKAEATQP